MSVRIAGSIPVRSAQRKASMLAIMGDVHGEWWALSLFAKRAEKLGVKALIQVGDFGFGRGLMELQELNIDIYAIGGNHESWPMLREHDLKTEPVRMSKNVWYVPRGCSFEVDGRRVLGVGGAASIDYNYRTAGKSWFPADEIVLFEHVEKALKTPAPDIIVTHTIPETVLKRLLPGPTPNFGQSKDWFDPSGAALDLLLEKYPQTPWYAGHFHKEMKDPLSGIRVLNIDEVIVV